MKAGWNVLYQKLSLNVALTNRRRVRIVERDRMNTVIASPVSLPLCTKLD